MPSIDWYGPEKGHGGTGEKVAYTKPVAREVKATANKIALKAQWYLESRPAHRKGHSQIEVKHWPTPGRWASTGPNIDSVVYLTDPWIEPNAQGKRKGATQAIENGHWIRDKQGNKVRWIEGHHVLNDAADSV
jgi:hypothetical protein